ncbi:MAG: hypothetical protein GY870_08940 [archaeon]|nr:hypothetical protein [archaeon]
MSIHGNQKFLPFILDKTGKVIDSPADYSIAFKKLIDRKKADEKIVSFSRLAWPFILIHGTPSSHIVFDDVGVCNLSYNITNAPRQGTVGHILRNIDNLSYHEILDRVEEVLKYTETGKKIRSSESKDEEEEEVEEFKKIGIKGMISPEIIDGLNKLSPKSIILPISEYSLLESKYSVELCLDLAQEYRNLIELSKGNKIRWKNLKGVIQDPFDNWLAELTVQIKDEEMRFKSAINKEESSITETGVKSALDSEIDSLHHWSLKEKKILLEKIGKSFFSIDQTLEEMRKKTKFFLDTDSFKKLKVETAIKKAKEHSEYLDDSRKRMAFKIKGISQKLDSLIASIEKIDKESENKFKNKELELKTRLAQRNSRMQTVNQASRSLIRQLKEEKEIMSKKLEEIHEIVEEKMNKCEQDLQNLLNWGLLDTISKYSMPVLRIFMPVFSALLEDEEEDERLIFAFPCIVEKNLETSPLCSGFDSLERLLEKLVDDDMKIRSNFEFTMEKQNFLKNEKNEKIITDGFKILHRLGLSDDSISQNYIKKLKI